MGAVKRMVSTNFWLDSKVVEEFTPEDKYFFLYLLTNPHTTQLGIYELNIKQAAFELGYSSETVGALLERFEKKYNMINYNKPTKEIVIKNFLIHSIMKGGKPVEDCLAKEIGQVKEQSLISVLFENLISKEDIINETVKIVIKKYLDKDKINDNEKDNDNENERFVPRVVGVSLNNGGKPTTSHKQNSFIKPTIEELKDYIKEQNYDVDAEQFIAFYDSNGWKVGKNPMKSWKGAITTWGKRNGLKPKSEKEKLDEEWEAILK